jgi:hypothetical protein
LSEEPPVEPDLSNPWRRSVWLYGLRLPFSFVLLGWLTFAQSLAPSFSLEVYLYTILSAFLGLVVGAHYIDVATSEKKFSPYFKVPRRRMLYTGVVFVALGAAVGVYISFRWNALFLIFVGIETFAAIAYPREKPRFAHSYTAFAVTWGAIPFLASYFIQAASLSLVVVGGSVFVGLSTLMMHHLAIMTRESNDWQNAMYLLTLYRYAVYSVGFLSLVGRLAVI